MSHYTEATESSVENELQRANIRSTRGFGEAYEEKVMDARMRLEAITTRIGAVAFPLGVILLVVATAIHPSREDPMDNPAVFLEYAQSESWIAIHFGQWFAALLLIGGLLAVYYTLRTKAELGAEVARFGFVAAVLTAAAFTMLQAVDGVALKWAVDVWADGQRLPPLARVGSRGLWSRLDRPRPDGALYWLI